MGNLQLNTTDFEQDFISVSLITDSGYMNTTVHRLSLLRFAKQVQTFDEISKKSRGSDDED